MYRKLLFYLLVIILINNVGCVSKSNSSFQKIRYLSNGKIITLPLPDDVVPNTFCLKAGYFNGQDFLYFFNRPTYQILIFNLDTENVTDVIQMKKDGPNGFTGFKGFSIKSRDRIIVSSINRKLYTINLAGEVLNVTDYKQIKEVDEYTRPVTLNQHHNDIYYTTTGMVIPQTPPYRDEEKNINSNRGKIGKSIFIKVNGEIKSFSDQKLTSDILEEIPQRSSLQMTSTFRDDTLYWSFIESMTVYYSEISGGQSIKKKTFPFPDKRNDQDMQSMGLFGYYAKSTLCRRLIYDEYRDKFYRMVRYGVNDPDEMYGRDLEYVARYPVKFSIFVMDKDLNPEKEVYFEGIYYDFDRFFIASDGFYLSLNNPENPDFDEDYLRFERIEL